MRHELAGGDAGRIEVGAQIPLPLPNFNVSGAPLTVIYGNP